MVIPYVIFTCVLLLQFCGVGRQISEEFFYSMELDGDGITRGSCIKDADANFSAFVTC